MTLGRKQCLFEHFDNSDKTVSFGGFDENSVDRWFGDWNSVGRWFGETKGKTLVVLTRIINNFRNFSVLSAFWQNCLDQRWLEGGFGENKRCFADKTPIILAKTGQNAETQP